jgi:hypothetical protein
MKIWQDSIIAVQLGNRAKLVVQNIGIFLGRKRKQPKKKLKHKETI